jgi:hypothetical protein
LILGYAWLQLYGLASAVRLGYWLWLVAVGLALAWLWLGFGLAIGYGSISSGLEIGNGGCV